MIALCLLYVGLLPGSLSKGLTSLYYAHERAEYPAAVATVTTISKAVLNIGALLLGFGIIGLAASSIINNFVTLGILLYGARAMIGRPKLQPETAAIGGMARQSWPLMLNHFLATIFFQIDVVIIEAIHGARMVGQYSVAYRWLLALNVIPAFFTQAFLPMMSRQANEDRDALRRDVTLALKGLAALSFPLAVGFTFLAHPLTWLLGGQEFLPDGAIALQLMIWSIPIGWLNSLTQYHLIALDKQRMITRAFAVGVTFNIATNLLLVPTYGYRAAALTTIASEAVLFIGFAWLLRGSLGGLNWPGIVWRPATASGVMAVLMAALWTSLPVVAVVGGSAIYLGVLLALRPLSATETARLAPMLPGRIRRAVLVTA